MNSKEQFESCMEDAMKYWTEALAPSNPAERRLIRSIARQDFLMFATVRRAIEANDEPMVARCMRIQRDLAATLDSLVHALSTLQRQRLSLDPPPPVAAKKSRAKVIAFPKSPSIASVGRPAKVELEEEPTPARENFGPARRRKQRGADPTLDFKIAA